MLEIEVDNRSGGPVDAEGAEAFARAVLAAEGVEDGELGLAFVAAEEMRGLKREHLPGEGDRALFVDLLPTSVVDLDRDHQRLRCVPVSSAWRW